MTKVVTPAQERVIEIPGETKTFTSRKLVKEGGFSEYREVLCGNKIDVAKITQIQRALKAAGYEPGPIDNVFGAQTKQALIKFQKDKGLPIGNLDMETLKALNVSNN
jgi:N-acetyl-anhydromuramyl-L-alanine amidase AmpD